MNVLIFGATGGMGRELVAQALAQGHTVTAFARNPQKVTVKHERLAVHRGNVLDTQSVENAVREKDVVLSALGNKRWFLPNTLLSDGTRNIVAAMEKHSVKRFVCMTSLGIGDSRGKLGLYYTLFVIPVIVFFYFRDKELQEQIIKESKLDWVIVRPGQFTLGKKQSAYRHGTDIGNWLFTVRISRADVADFMLKQLTDSSYVRKTPGIAY